MIKYSERIYRPGAYQFESFKETEEQQTMLLQTSALDDAHDLWQQANARCNAKLYVERKVLLAAQRAMIPEAKRSQRFIDIEEYYQKNGKGTHFLEYEFAPDAKEAVAYISDKSGATKFFWCWTHN